MKKRHLILILLALLLVVIAVTVCEGQPVDPDEGEIQPDGTRLFKVPNAYFTFEKYNVVIKSPSEVGDGFSVISSNELEIYASCVSSLDDVVAIIKLYDAKGALVGNYRSSMHDCEIDKKEEFVLKTEISDEARDNFSVVDVYFEGKTANRVYRADSITYNVTYVYNNGTPSDMAVVDLGTTLSVPNERPQKDGCVFSGWYTDPLCTEAYDFDKSAVENDLTLYAGYVPNYLRMGQKVSNVMDTSAVRITVKSYSSLLFGTLEVTSSEKIGEGIIISEGSGYYYVLTTHDLVTKEEGYENVSYTIEDGFGNQYTATLKHSGAGYNLGVLYFEKGRELLVSSIAKKPPEIGTEISIAKHAEEDGYYACFGRVLRYEQIAHENIDTNAHDIRFDMMIHDVDTDERVSGRPVFNLDLELVGIQCGTLKSDSVEVEHKHVITIEAIKKYIEAYGI